MPENQYAMLENSLSIRICEGLFNNEAYWNELVRFGMSVSYCPSHYTWGKSIGNLRVKIETQTFFKYAKTSLLLLVVA